MILKPSQVFLYAVSLSLPERAAVPFMQLSCKRRQLLLSLFIIYHWHPAILHTDNIPDNCCKSAAEAWKEMSSDDSFHTTRIHSSRHSHCPCSVITHKISSVWYGICQRSCSTFKYCLLIKNLSPKNMFKLRSRTKMSKNYLLLLILKWFSIDYNHENCLSSNTFNVCNCFKRDNNTIYLKKITVLTPSWVRRNQCSNFCRFLLIYKDTSVITSVLGCTL